MGLLIGATLWVCCVGYRYRRRGLHLYVVPIRENLILNANATRYQRSPMSKGNTRMAYV
jgi:hypothetical protein